MSERLRPIDGSVLEGISKTLGDTNNGLTGPEIGKFLLEVNIFQTLILQTQNGRDYIMHLLIFKIRVEFQITFLNL